jgi:hypothetical protein
VRFVAPAIASAALVAACAGGSPAGQPATSPRAASATPAGPRHSPAPLSARVILPSRTVTAGSSLSGRVVVENNTGHPVRAWGCLTLFQVILFSDSYRPSPAWAACLQSFTIPVGESSYPVTVDASYLQCLEHGTHGGVKGCLPDGRTPPLPPGTYRARFVQSRQLFPEPPAITVRVTAPSRASP